MVVSVGGVSSRRACGHPLVFRGLPLPRGPAVKEPLRDATSRLLSGPAGLYCWQEDVDDMKTNNQHRNADRDTMRPEYDFSKAVRGVTAARYAQGANVIVIDPEVLDVFPDSAAVNATLRALAPVFRQQRRRARRVARSSARQASTKA